MRGHIASCSNGRYTGNAAKMNATLDHLPREILLLILSFLSVPDLLQCSRTCHDLRSLCLDPLLHEERRKWAIASLQIELTKRKSRAELSPPQQWIYLSRTFVLSRSIDRSLVKIRLAHNLTKRPRFNELVARCVLPKGAHLSPLLIQAHHELQKCNMRTQLNKKLNRRPRAQDLVHLNILPQEWIDGKVSPGLIETQRRVIKETLKDGLRSWVENRGLKAQQDWTERQASVKSMIRLLTAKSYAHELELRHDRIAMQMKEAQLKYGRPLQHKILRERRDPQFANPTRAHVYALKTFWEKVHRSAIV